MKKFLFSLLVILIILASVPFAEGYYFKSDYLKLIDQINAHINRKEKLMIVDYRVGWLSSQVKLQFITDANDRPMGFITIDQQITHGPIIYDAIEKQFYFKKALIHSLVHIPDLAEMWLLGTQHAQGIMQIKSIVGFNDAWDNQINMPAINLSFPLKSGETSFAWQGISGNYFFQLKDDHVINARLLLNTGTLNATSPEMSIAVQSGTLSGSSLRQGDNSGEANVALMMPSILLTAKGEQMTGTPDQEHTIFNLSHFYFKQNFSPSHAKLNISYDLGWKSLELPTFFVPQITDMNFSTVVHNINLSALTNIQQSVRDDDLIDKVSTDAAARKKLETLITQPIMADTLVAINASLNTPFGHAILNQQINWQTPPTSFNDMYNQLNLKSEFHIAKDLVNKINDYLNQKQYQNPPDVLKNQFNLWVQQAYVLVDNNDYIFLVTKAPNGPWKLNGKEPPKTGPLYGARTPGSESPEFLASNFVNTIQSVVAASDSLSTATGSYIGTVTQSSVQGLLGLNGMTLAEGSNISIAPTTPTSILMTVTPPPSTNVCQIILQHLSSSPNYQISPDCHTVTYTKSTNTGNQPASLSQKPTLPAPISPEVNTSGPKIHVVAGTYGSNCGAPRGNKTAWLTKACEGKTRCDYIISVDAIGDPAYGCAKNYIAEWQCGNNPTIYQMAVTPEAGNNKEVILSCEIAAPANL